MTWVTTGMPITHLMECTRETSSANGKKPMSQSLRVQFFIWCPLCSLHAFVNQNYGSNVPAMPGTSNNNVGLAFPQCRWSLGTESHTPYLLLWLTTKAKGSVFHRSILHAPTLRRPLCHGITRRGQLQFTGRSIPGARTRGLSRRACPGASRTTSTSIPTLNMQLKGGLPHEPTRNKPITNDAYCDTHTEPGQNKKTVGRNKPSEKPHTPEEDGLRQRGKINMRRSRRVQTCSIKSKQRLSSIQVAPQRHTCLEVQDQPFRTLSTTRITMFGTCRRSRKLWLKCTISLPNSVAPTI